MRGRKGGSGRRQKNNLFQCIIFGGSDVDVLNVWQGRAHSGIAETRLLILHEIDSKLHNVKGSLETWRNPKMREKL